MKAQEKQQVAAMSVEELEARLRELRESHFRLRFRHTTNPLKNPMEIRHARREIARIETLIRSKKK